MKKLIATVIILGFAANADQIADTAQPGSTNVVAVTTMADGSPNTWTLADLQAALGLLNRKYHREVERPDGRKAWHGKLMREVILTNELQKVEYYEDGTSFSFPFMPKTSAAAVSNRNARLTTVMTNGVPRALAEARMRRAQEKATTNIVTVVAGPAEAK